MNDQINQIAIDETKFVYLKDAEPTEIKKYRIKTYYGIEKVLGFRSYPTCYEIMSGEKWDHVITFKSHAYTKLFIVE